MSSRARVHCVAFFLVATACASTPDPGATARTCTSGLPDSSACPTSAPSYSGEIQGIISERCLACHYPGNKNSEQVLATYDDVHASLTTVEKEVYRCDMPPAGEPQLTSDERQALLAWLVCGAPNN